MGSDANLGASAGGLTFDGGTLQVTGTTFTATGRTIVWGDNGGGFDIAAAGNTFTVSQPLGGAGGLTKLGAGALVLSGSNSYSGATTVEAGTLAAGADSAFSVNSAMIVDGTLDLGGFANEVGALSGSGAITNSGAGVATLETLIYGRTTTFSGSISGATVLAINGTGGVLELTGQSSFTGGVWLYGGELIVGNDAALGTGLLRLEPGTTLGFSGVAGEGTLANDILLTNLDPTIAVGPSQTVTLSGTISGTDQPPR